MMTQLKCRKNKHTRHTYCPPTKHSFTRVFKLSVCRTIPWPKGKNVYTVLDPHTHWVLIHIIKMINEFSLSKSNEITWLLLHSQDIVELMVSSIINPNTCSFLANLIWNWHPKKRGSLESNPEPLHPNPLPTHTKPHMWCCLATSSIPIKAHRWKRIWT